MPQILRIVSDITTGKWRHEVGSREAVNWTIPLLYASGALSAGAWTWVYGVVLAFERPDAGRLVDAAEALWSHPDLDGSWLKERRGEAQRPADEPKVGPAILEEDQGYPFGPPEFKAVPALFGLARPLGRPTEHCQTHYGLGENLM